ncbi:vitamin B12-dependent ribonucleotide reductase [Clostridium grantii]|uniref:vitamin B12-dependent ribonucleotide reductase n=1 Tax=Clostridium grantii TaxID=40575 RepID=UPI0009348DF1
MVSLSGLFKRHFTKDLINNPTQTVYDLFSWKKVNVHIKNHKTGDIIFEMKNLEFPEHYSQNACDIIASKYFRKTGIPNEIGYENSMKMVAHRMVNFWAEALFSEGLIKSENEKEIYYDEMVYALLNQMYAPNSPQWFNTGLKLSYGIEGNSQGNFYYDIKENKVVECLDAYSRTQASACFILSIEDKLLGSHSISEQYVTETKLFKGGSGTGTNFSSIRGVGEILSGGGYSSGLMSFLKGLDRNAGAIKSGGTTRRAAKMLCLNIDHPEIYDFITWKSKEENKVRALSKMGYDASFEGEAYETVSGQNGNNSVRFSKKFMQKVENLHNDPAAIHRLKGRIDSSVSKEVKVSDLWDTFNKSAWECADPAPMFDDIFNAWHTCPSGENGKYNAPNNRINSTNPCGEYAFLDDTACNLASINVYKFYNDANNEFDIDSYIHLTGLIQLALEASVFWGQFPTKDIARKTHLFRTTGLGLANLASLLMVKGVPYNSDEARAFTASLVGIMTGQSYFVSALMAKASEPFECYEINKKSMLRVIRNHCRVAGVITSPYENLGYLPQEVNHLTLESFGLGNLSKALKDSWIRALEFGNNYGFRNAQVSVIAPTGTISLAMDCGATSIEPFFSHVVYKKLSGGGYMTIANPVLPLALKNLGYSKTERDEIVNYIMKSEITETDGFKYEKIVDGKLEGAPFLKDEHLSIFDTANVCGSGQRYISPMGHVKMVAAITPLISGAVSKTVNLPASATVDAFKNVVLSSWQLGVKGISLYRDGSKASQPLNNSLDTSISDNLEDLTYHELLEKAKNLQLDIDNKDEIINLSKNNSDSIESTNNDFIQETHEYDDSESPYVKDVIAQQHASLPSSVDHHYSKREKITGIRTGRTHPAQIDDLKFYTTVNRSASGEIAEVYITTDREGTIIMGLLNSLSKSISVMLQYHVPPNDIANMLRGQKYEPYGFVKNHPYIKFVTSISDLISKIIDIELGDFTRCQVKPEQYTEDTNVENKYSKSSVAFTSTDNHINHEKEEEPKHKNKPTGHRVYDSCCTICSSTRLVKNGTCKVCLDCGSTTGCS